MVRVLRVIVAFSLLIVVCASAFAAGREYDDVTIQSQTLSEIVFEYRPGSLYWDTDTEGEFPAIDRTATGRVAGRPTIPGRIIYIALPPGTRTVTADLISTAGSSEGNRASLEAGIEAGMSYPYPSEQLMTDDVFNLRGLQMARLVVHPLQVIDAAGDYRLTTDFTVRVRFGAASGAGVPAAAGIGRPDAFTGILSALVLNPDRVAEWRRPETRKLAAATTDVDPFAGADQWIAININDEGIVEVTPADLLAAGVSLVGADPRQFRLFGGPGRMISTLMSAPQPTLTEVAVAMNGDADGSFDPGDSFDFYAQSLNRWDYDANGKPEDVVNRYARQNVYWLALSGSFAGSPKRIATTPAATPSAGATDYFSAFNRVRHESDNLFRIGSFGEVESYYTWYWRNVQSDRIFMTAVRLPETGAPARVEIGSHSSTAHLRIGSAGVDTLPEVRLNAGEDGTRITTFDVAAFNPGDAFTLTFDTFSPGDNYLDYYSVEYQRRLSLASGAFRFPSPGADGLVTEVIAGVTAPEVWDVTDPFTPARLTGLTIDGAVARFGLDQRTGDRHVFYAWQAGDKHKPASLRRANHTDLCTPAAPADYLVIGPRAFQSACAPFMAYRASTSGLATRYVAIEDIYDAFGLGIADPLAIRRFLRHTYRQWPAPAPVYALLVGDGSYDFLDRTLSQSVSHVPPYIVPDDESVSDDNYVYFGDKQVLNVESDQSGNPFPDMLIGRWPAKTAADIQNIAAKIEDYESNASLGAWRSRFVLVADDEFGDRSVGSVNEIFHVRDAEDIANSYIPPQYDIQKIYLTEYPFDNPGCKNPNATGCRKPGVNAAIVSALNNGAGIFDYIGHGNKDLLAHERVFQRTVELPTLTNAGMATAVFTFSCSIGFFDDPRSEGTSEDWIRMPSAGAVSVVSATRLVYASKNTELNKKFFELLLNEERPGIAASLFTAKLLRQYNTFTGACRTLPCPIDNDRRYMLLGDPAMDLGAPRNRVRFTSIEPDTMRALALTQVEGTVTDTNGVLLGGFNGTVYLTAQDAPQHRVYRVNESTSVDYDLPGGTLYRGQVEVTNGHFDFGFVVPKDIAYGSQGARILAHAASGDQMAAGVAGSLWIAGSSGVLQDTLGPLIALESAQGEMIDDGYLLAQGAELVLRIFDTSGVNLTGAPGHRIEVYSGADDTPIADLTDLFVYEPGLFSRGEARFTLPTLAKGRQPVAVRAWDNANNSSLLSVELEITDPGNDDQFRISEFLNYPNPFGKLTTFYFQATRSVENARIRVFTLAGRLIWEYPGAVDGVTTWDGVDLDGDPVGNGVYLAQIEASGQVASGAAAVDKKAYKEIKLVLAR